jgi:predicted PurR-regulated permease PerM
VIAYGLVGLFIGAVLLAVGWVLMLEWLGTSDASAEEPVRGKGTLQAAE